MDTLQLLLLALVQGITEFLPISSSAHLILVPMLTGWRDQGIEVDVATHLGTLAAVLVYFGAVQLRAGADTPTPMLLDKALLWKVALATVPVIIVGWLVKDLAAGEWRSSAVIATSTIVFGVLLYLADRKSGARALDNMSLSDAMIIGAAQVLALIPGVSRSGITMTAAMFLRYSRVDAARFSLLLSIPTILGASALIGYDLYSKGSSISSDVWLAACLAFCAALIAIKAMMFWLRHASFTPFVLYRLALGGILLAWLYL